MLLSGFGLITEENSEYMAELMQKTNVIFHDIQMKINLTGMLPYLTILNLKRNLKYCFPNMKWKKNRQIYFNRHHA